ncbi:ABC transporter ATP-binding protein [Xenorhabdus bovienii]
MKLVSSQHKRLAAAMLLAVCYSLLALVPYVIVYQLIVDFLNQPEIAAQHVWWMVIMAALALTGKILLQLASGLLSHQAAFQLLFELRKQVIERIGCLPLSTCHQHTSAKLKKIIADDIGRIETFVAHHLPDMAAAVMTPVGAAVLLFFFDWRLALAMLSTLPLAVCAYFLTRRYARRWQTRVQSWMFRLNDGLMEYIDGLKELKAYQMVGGAFQRLNQVLDTTYKKSLTAEKAGVWPIYSFNLLVECGFIVLLVALTWGWLGHSLSLAEVLVFLIAAVRFFRPLLNMSMFLAELNYFGLAVGRIQKVFEMPVLSQGNLRPDITAMRIRLENIGFAYPDQPALFNNLNLLIEENKITALVGPSGSGKSTLASLIARFWDIEQGNIWVGEQHNPINLAEMDAEYWQRFLSVVFQKNYMLNDTIANNLKIARPGATEEKLLSVCRSAQLLPLLNKLPEGLDTYIGAGGVHLSGGELQRLSIARVLLKDAPLVILDEATASLDPENEREIQLAMQSLIQRKTVLVIAHKLSSIQYADKIVVMDQGDIVEEGTHSELIDRQGLYHELWQLQQQTQSWGMGAGCE